MHKGLNNLQQEIVTQKVDALLISSIPHIVYLTNYNGFSLEEREAFILITKNKKYIITDTRYSEAVKTLMKDFTLLEINHTSSLKDLLQKVTTKHSLKLFGFEASNISVAEYKRLSKVFKLKPIDLSHVRLLKRKAELKEIENACNLGDRVFEYLIPHIQQGVTEKELAFEIEFFIKQEGHDISFRPIVAFGPHSAIPHHNNTNKKLTKNNFVLLDFGARVNNYCSDMTRTVFYGSANAEQKKIYQTVLDANLKAIEALQKNKKAADIDKVARDYIIQKGYPSIPHSLGHGTGIEVHEPPRLSPKSKDTLTEGMVFSIEPGIYIPQEGGVRIEDLVVLEKSGPRVLTQSPKELIQL